MNAAADTLLRAAEQEFYQLYWSADILAEVRRNLVDKGRMTEAQASRLLRAMQDVFPEAEVTGYERLIPSMTNHPKDRHVAAAAAKAGAQVIVTQNLKDFRSLPEGIVAQTADQFLTNILNLDPPRFVER